MHQPRHLARQLALRVALLGLPRGRGLQLRDTLRSGRKVKNFKYCTASRSSALSQNW